MQKSITEILESDPVIAAVKNDAQLAQALKSSCSVIFLLYGDVCSISQLVDKVVTAGKLAFVHIDLVSGLSNKEITVDFIKAHTRAEGIISTRPPLVKRAGMIGMLTILRIFALDSMALDNLEKQVGSAGPDAIEVLPGVMPKIFKRISGMVSIPVIAGGLISDKEDVMNALSSGAVCVSTTNEALWTL